jgi:hypothetical protein
MHPQGEGEGRESCEISQKPIIILIATYIHVADYIMTPVASGNGNSRAIAPRPNKLHIRMKNAHTIM